MHVKGLELPAYDVRGAKAHGLGYATSYTGADHNKGYAIQEIFGLPFPRAVDRFAAEGKGDITMWNQDARTAVGDCPTMCIFMLDTSVAPFMFENTAGLMNRARPGSSSSPEDVRRVGERVNNVARAFNTMAGLTRADDDLPERLKTEPIPEGPAKGHMISQADLDLMLDEYYAARGWTPDGVPTRARLEDLRLGYVAGQASPAVIAVRVQTIGLLQVADQAGRARRRCCPTAARVADLLTGIAETYGAAGRRAPRRA